MHNSDRAPVVSIIIPVFNRSKHIEKLLVSISKQTYRDFEVICVDDGSTDNTLDIIRSFTREDSRFVCATQKHGGAGAARNRGLDLARGKYITFMDSDDNYRSELLMQMVTAAEENEVDEVFCLYEDYNFRTHVLIRDIGYDKNVLMGNAPVYTKDIEDLYQTVSWSPTNTLFCREIIQKHDLRFSTTHVANDMFFIYAYASLTKKILGLDKHLLTVRKFIDNRSLTASRWRHTEDSVTVMMELGDWLRENGLYDRYEETYRMLFVKTIKYNGGFPLNMKYAEALADALCGTDIFEDLSEEEFYSRYWFLYDTDRIRQKIGTIKEKKSREDIAQESSNLLLTIMNVERIAKEKYGRTLNPHTKHEDD